MNTETGFKGTPQLHDKIADINVTRQLLAQYLKTNKAGAVTLLNLNGVKIDKTASLNTVTAAFLKAIYASDSFRTQASQAMSNYALSLKKSFTGGKYHNATDEYGNYYDENSSTGPDYLDPSQPWLGVALGGGSGSTSSSSSSSSGSSSSSSGSSSSGSSSSSGGFWSSLGNIFSKDVIQSGIKTGLGALSTSISSSATNSSNAAALKLEQTKLAELQAANNLKNTPGASTGLSTGWKIAIGVGVAAILTTMIVLVVRKK
jgi:hypothetical protein